jgi:diguanylate cyclase (GGDEF)-like protein
MDESCETKILILSSGVESARWAKILREPDSQVWLGREAIPADGQPDVIVTDDAGPTTPARGEVGIVRVGVEGPGDVHLPCDFSPREMQTACRLLGQVVRLRRRERAAAETHRALAADARTDPLTGLPNRRAWDAELAERFAAAPRPPLCLAVVDLDHFKRVNDEHGHIAGDRVLCEAARAIAGGVRQDDFVARLGGDEFGIVLGVPDAVRAGAIVGRVRAGVRPHLVAAGVQMVTASAGYAVSCGASEGSVEALFAAADAALRRAKRRGRNRTVSA